MLLEIVTMSGTPYPTIVNKDLVTCMKSSYCMERPDNCADPMHEMMQRRWQEDPWQRSTSFKLRDNSLKE